MINLENELTLKTSPLSAGVNFVCDYSTSVDVQSDAFIVQDVSIHGTQSGYGSLTGGFTLSAGDGTPTVLGNELTVTALWTLNLSDVSAHYDSCSVTQGTQSVSIVKYGCMATTLGAQLVPNASGVTNEVSMKYKTFTVENEVATEQIVTCDVKLCTGTTNCVHDKTTCAGLSMTDEGAFGYQ